MAVIALVVIGYDHPQLRQTLQDILQEIITVRISGPRHAGSTTIMDGDALDVAGARVRLYGIDAPEKVQTCRRGRLDRACGMDGTQALIARIDGRTVSCEEQQIDRYGRSVGIRQAGTSNLNAWMVRNRYTVAYRQHRGDLDDSEETVAQAGWR